MKEQLIDIEPTIVITMKKGMETEEARDFLKALCVHAKSWSGEGDYRFVVRLRLGTTVYCTIPVHDFAGNTCRVPHDPEHMDMLILNFPQISTIKFDRKFDRWADWYSSYEKPKKTGWVKIKERPPYVPPEREEQLKFLDCEEAKTEARALMEIIKPWPFSHLSADENRLYIEHEVIACMPTKWPYTHEINRMFDGDVVKYYRLAAEPRNQQRLPDLTWRDVAYLPFRATMGEIRRRLSDLPSHIRMKDKIEAKEKEQKSSGKWQRQGYRPITEEDSGDRYLEQASAAVGRIQYDPSLDDDTPRTSTKIVVKNKYAR